eukprot:14711430-Alexandrium_andersonii.AAC.1
MLKHWCCQAPMFTRSRWHQQLNPRSEDPPDAQFLDLAVGDLGDPPELVQNDFDLDAAEGDGAGDEVSGGPKRRRIERPSRG